MFTIVIGQSGAGKTTFVKERLLKEPYEVKKDIVAYTECGNGVVALGKYGTGKRTDGTDTLSYSAKENIKKQLTKFAAEGRDVVMEGDRINNREVFEHIAKLGVKVKLYLVRCTLGTSMKRLRAAGSTITPTFVKTTQTKARNMFEAYRLRFDGEQIINELERTDIPAWKHEE